MPRHHVHPAAKQAELAAEGALERSRSVPQTGWAWPYGWRVKLRMKHDGTWRIRELPASTTYAEAAASRDAEMRSGVFDLSWMEKKVTP